MEDEREELAELYTYLGERHYGHDETYFIIATFKSLQFYYEHYTDIDSEMIDRKLFIKKYVNLLRRVEPVIFLKDINEDSDFVNAIKPIGEGNVPSGYIKDSDGRYHVANINPEYWCSLVGLTNNITKKVTILYDATVEYRMWSVYETLIHELTHINQQGFELPWYVMNRNLFLKFLREGHAMSESKYVGKQMSGGSSIPFVYNEVANKFQMQSDNIEYRIYKYLYLKLEILLGHDFLNTWATAKDDNTFMAKAYRLIDAKYGKGTFKKLYESILIILNSRYSYSKEELKTIVEEQEYISTLTQRNKGESLENIIQEYKRTVRILEDDSLFKTAFEEEKRNLLSTKQTFKGVDLGNNTFMQHLDDRIAKLTEEAYRHDLENMCSSLEEEIEAKADANYFKILTGCNVNVGKEMLHNPDYLTDTIVRLETLVLKCIQKDLDNHLVEGTGNFKKYRYYIYNMGNKIFTYKAMRSVKKQIDYLSMNSFLQEHAQYLKPKEESPSK